MEGASKQLQRGKPAQWSEEDCLGAGRHRGRGLGVPAGLGMQIRQGRRRNPKL